MINLDTLTIDKLQVFSSRFTIDKNGCWVWIKGKNNGGYASYGSEAGHRFIYRLMGKKIPPQHDIDHLCRVRACVNPKHLEAVTRSENLNRGNMTGWYMTKTHCPQGHEYSVENSYIWNVKGLKKKTCRTCYLAYKKQAYKKVKADEEPLDYTTHDDHIERDLVGGE